MQSVVVIMGIETVVSSTFLIESELGSGGCGAVNKAWHTRLRKYVVVKEFKHGSNCSSEIRRNEVEALKNVKSAYLPQVFDFLTEADRSFTVLEFIEGESFDKLLKRGQSFSQMQVIRWYLQLASALESLHKLSIYHRDIKPSNVMLTPGGDICLIDFNTALVGGNETHFVSRSKGYASPEQCELFQRLESARCGSANAVSTGDVRIGTPDAGNATVLTGMFSLFADCGDKMTVDCIDWKRSDIYSLGATMRHIMTGKHPPWRDGETGSISESSQYSKCLMQIIERSMSIAPDKRFASMEEVAAAVLDV